MTTDNDVVAITPLMKAFALACVEFGWDASKTGEASTGVLYGIELAMRHPAWAKALVEECTAWTGANGEDIRDGKSRTLDDFVALVNEGAAAL